jgi:hypothetical protein
MFFQKMKTISKLFVILVMFIVLLLILVFKNMLEYKANLMSNWTGNAERVFDTIYKPSTIRELESIMKDLPPSTEVIISGGGHSWSPSMYIDGTNTINSNITPVCLSLIDFKGDISYDENTSLVTCLAGTPMGELLHFLGTHKRSLATYPNSPYITIGGAVATCSHGASLKAGTISGLVTDMYYILPGYTECRRVPQHLLGAYACSLGRLGVVSKLTLNTIPISWLKQNNSFIERKLFLQNMMETIDKSDFLRVYWKPITDICTMEQIVRINNTENDVISLFDCKIKNHFMVWQSQELLYGINYSPELDTQFGLSYPNVSLENTTGYGMCQKQTESPKAIPAYAELEEVVSVENLHIALNTINMWIHEYNPSILGDVFVRFTSYDTLPWISPLNGSSNFYAWVIVDMDIRDPNYFSHLDILEKALWTKARARPHMGKWNNVDNKTLIEMYGNNGLKFIELSKNIQ